MPTYTVEIDGKQYDIEGDRPPTEEEARAAVSAWQPEDATPEKSVSGFVGNALKSGANLIKDTAVGTVKTGLALSRTPQRIAEVILSPVQTAKGVVAVAKDTPRIASQAASGLAGAAYDRYGSLSNIGETIYTDPFGVLADIATVASGGAMATATRAPKLAKALGAIERGAAAPMSMPLRVGAKAAERTGDFFITQSVTPSNALLKSMGGAEPLTRREAAAIIKRVGSTTSESAQRKLTASYTKADALLAEREAADAAGVPAKRIADALAGEPAAKAARRAELGVGDDGAALEARRKRIVAAATEAPESETTYVHQSQRGFLNGKPADVQWTQPTVKDISLTRAQALKREAQEMAYEAQKANLSVDAAGNRAVAKELRQGIEDVVPEVGPINQASQDALLAKRALSVAEERPGKLGVMLAPLSAGTSMLFSSPRIGTGAAIGLDRAAQLARSQTAQRVTLAARAAGLTEQELTRALLVQALEEQE
jgi:hypothetical protein